MSVINTGKQHKETKVPCSPAKKKNLHGVQMLTAGPVRESKTLVATCETEHLYSW